MDVQQCDFSCAGYEHFSAIMTGQKLNKNMGVHRCDTLCADVLGERTFT